jgi:hypothetical protein
MYMGSVAWERAMKIQEVILRAMAKPITRFKFLFLLSNALEKRRQALR